MNSHQVIKKPLVTEKTNVMKEQSNVYAFHVEKSADKPAIKRSVEEMFNVKVKSVRTLIQRGKYKKYGKDSGRTKAWKKAVVTLAEGNSLELFEGV